MSEGRSEQEWAEEAVRAIREFIDGETRNDYIAALFHDRPYDGQFHTDGGERGKEEVRGVTMRDLHDCFVIGCFQASGLAAENYPRSIYELPWDDMDPGAVASNMVCAVEQRMGIYPNLPPREADWRDDEPHEQHRRTQSALESMRALLDAMKPTTARERVLRDAALRRYWEAQ